MKHFISGPTSPKGLLCTGRGKLVDEKKEKKTRSEMRWEMIKEQDSSIEKLTVVNDAQTARIILTLN